VYEVYEKYREEISIALSPYELAWRNQDTGIIEITLPDFGYRTEPTEEQFRELARVAARLADTARKYFDQIRLVVTE
jgi:hypothetical protein